MKITYLLLVISLLLTGCKFIKNSNIDSTECQEVTINTAFIYEKPTVKIEHDKKYLQFPNSNTINISENYYPYKIDLINLYDSNDKKSQFFEIKNEDVLLYKLPENFEWLYCYASDSVHGFIYIYDISKESYYGNFDKNMESDNSFKILLIDEYILTNKYSNIKRYGPLLEIKYNNKIIMFWDFFAGEESAREYRYQLLDYYEKHNEIYIRKYLYKCSEDYIYNIQTANFVCKIEDAPYFISKP